MPKAKVWGKLISKIESWRWFLIGLGIIIMISVFFYLLFIKERDVFLSLVNKFGSSIAEALFWVLIIFSIAGALIWIFRSGINYFFIEEVQDKFTKPPTTEE